MPKRVGPEAKIISLFTALPDDSKRIVMDVLKSQTATPRKTATKKPVKAGAGCALPNCGLAQDAPVHQTDNDDYHVFHAVIKARGGKVNGEDKVQGATV